MLRFTFATIMLILLQLGGFAQGVPNCRDVNASVDEFGLISVTPMDFLTNISNSIDTVTVTITGDVDAVLFGPTRLATTDPITLPACIYVGKSLKVYVKNDLGGCWSNLSVKKVHGPVVQGRVFDIYCFDSLAHTPSTLPVVLDACGTISTARHVADWLIPYVCMPGIQDTVKVIFREWESIGKDGIRGVGFDTLVVFYLPEITDQNIYCVDKDTVYCNDLTNFTGPIISIPGAPLDPTTCLELPLLKVTDLDKDGILEFSSNQLDELCDFNTHIDWEIFEVDCSKQYKVTIDIKQSCYGAAQTACIVPTPAGTLPNIAENLAPGYWRCEFWLVDLDTVAPDLHCKYPVLFSGVFDYQDWEEVVLGDGYVDTTWAPYKISLVGNDDGFPGSTNYCIQPDKDSVLAFAWEFRSLNSDAMYDPFGYILNGVFFQLTEGIPDSTSGPVYQNGYKILELRAGDQFCFSQQSVDGLEGEGVTTIMPLPIVSTSDHDCIAHSYVPPVVVSDDWSGIKQVKARIPNIGTYVMSYNTETNCYESHERAPLPHRPEPYIIIYEAQDSCHNTALDTCYILVKDRVKPTAVVDKGITVSLSEKKVWVNAEDFDEGSFDNCEVNLLLVRRADWFESCVDLCDDLDTVCVNQHGDTLWVAQLESNKDIEPVEAHYHQILQWLKDDGGPCTNIIYNAWIYDLIQRSTLHCKEHPYEITIEHVQDLLEECLPSVMNYFLPVALHPDPTDEGAEIDAQEDFKVDSRLLQTYQQIGGGWSDAVPFDCEDACGSVTVEILVMDYWCNWSKAWTQVWVEDKVPVQVVKDVEDQEITCKIYKTARYNLDGYNDPLSIESIIDLAKEKDEAALGALDAIFGGYKKVWKGPYGNYLDVDGNEVESEIPFVDSTCYCEIDDIVQKRLFDEHLGYYWEADTIWNCGYEARLDTFNQGLVLANCTNYIGCDQEIWCEIDHCGEGYIYRKFRIWHGCPASYYTDEGVPEDLKSSHLPDTVTRTQKIRIYNECTLDKHMFDVPDDVEIVSCGIQYDEDGSGKLGGDLHPDKLGWMRYRLDDDCRLIGIDYEDQVFKIVGGDAACYKILRTWYYMDWCEGQPVDKEWYHHNDLEFDSCIQHIFLIDTLAPVCSVVGPVDDRGTIEVGDCFYDFSATVNMEDSCGIVSYRWLLYEVSDIENARLIDGFESDKFETPQTSFEVMVDDLDVGTYQLKVLVTDDCGNDGQCAYHFDVVTVKKPTAICITSLTARLNPMDLDQDGLIDTAMVTIWANEYDRSSRVACADTSLEFRIELKDGVDDETWMEDADSIQLGCAHVGTKVLRLWVISWPSGTADYCDIVGVIVSNEGCGEMPADTVTSVTETILEQVQNTNHIKKPDFQDSRNDVILPLKLNVEENGEERIISLSQNYPNPFSHETIINFELPEEMEVRLSIFDINGKMIHTTKQQCASGINSVIVKGELFSAGGIYYYQLATAKYQSTRRMVFIE